MTDRVRAPDMLARSKGQIAHAARLSMLGELTASIAHEVSQPLTAIGTNAEATLAWLSGVSPNLAEVRELAARTAAEVQRAADILHRIRAMAVRSVPEQCFIPINPLIEEALLFLRHEFQQRGVEVSLQLENDLPDVLGDRVQLQQVVVNLAVNAVQAMHDAGIAARQLFVKSSLGADGWISIAVEDTGPGIAPDLRDRVFDRFFTTKSTGMGMGLAICRTIVEAHDGQIGVANRLDAGGAVFTMRFPPAYRIFPGDSRRPLGGLIFGK